MSEFTWAPEAEEAAHRDPSPESSNQESGTLALTADEFSSLEDRILRAVNLVKRERLARTAAEERAAQAEARVADQGPQIEQLEKEINSLRAERDQVKQRVERLLSQLDTLEL